MTHACCARRDRRHRDRRKDNQAGGTTFNCALTSKLFGGIPASTFCLDSLARASWAARRDIPTRLLLSCIFVLLVIAPLAAEDASIDRLLSKLPAPEKIVKPSAPHSPQQKDPALQDPLFVRSLPLLVWELFRRTIVFAQIGREISSQRGGPNSLG
jgi:hypothetical protein